MKRSAGAPDSSQPNEALLRRIVELESQLADANANAEAVQARLNLAMVSAGLYWWEWDVEADIIRHFGRHPLFLDGSPERASVTVREWVALVHPDDLPLANASIEPCLRGESDVWSCELRLQTTSGEWRWVANGARVAERDAQGRALRVLGTTQDVHARKSAEDRARRDAHILAQLQDVVVCTDAEARVVYWNQAAERVFGWKSEELLGRSLASRFPPHMHDTLLGLVADILSRDQTPARQWEDYRKDGSRVWIHWRAHRFTDAEGNVSGMVSVGTDMTEQLRAAEEQKKLQQQLFHAQKMETIGTLAGGIAHDFNNILAAIVVYTELAINEAQGNERGLECLGEVKRASHRAKELVRRILAFSRFNEPDRRRIDLRILIEDAVRFVRPMLPSTLEIRLDLPENCPPSRADQNQIHQVILNLLSNSAQAMRNGTGHVIVRMRAVEFKDPHVLPLGTLSAGRYLSIAVEDNGQGIDADTVKRIFDPFFTTKKPGEGTGLGLSVVHGIIHNHEGGLSVESTPGEGSTFTFYLPSTTPSPSAARAPRSVPPSSSPRGRGERVLVVDDEDSVARLIAAALETLGYKSLCFTSVDDLLREFQRAPEACQLLITDQTMPRVTGVELAQKLRGEGHRIPVLIVSGFSRVLKPELLSALGRTAVLSKPFEIHELAVAVRRLLVSAASPESHDAN